MCVYISLCLYIFARFLIILKSDISKLKRNFFQSIDMSELLYGYTNWLS